MRHRDARVKVVTCRGQADAHVDVVELMVRPIIYSALWPSLIAVRGISEHGESTASTSEESCWPVAEGEWPFYGLHWDARAVQPC